MAIDDGHGLLVLANENTEVLEAPLCLVRHEAADELGLKDRHSIGRHDRQVVSFGVDTDRRSFSFRKQSSNPVTDVASWDVPEIAQAKYVQRMNFERLGKVICQKVVFDLPTLPTNLRQLYSHVVETHCQLVNL